MTQAQWERTTGERPSRSAADPCRPVEQVSRDDARAALLRIGLRLPSEAEREGAARAGTTTPWWTGNDEPDAGSAGHLHRPGTSVVGRYRPNPFGPYDSIGNVRERCEDTWHDSYLRSPGDGSARVGSEFLVRVMRGSSFDGDPETARSACRSRDAAAYEGRDRGVRPAMGLSGGSER